MLSVVLLSIAQWLETLPEPFTGNMLLRLRNSAAVPQSSEYERFEQPKLSAKVLA